MLGNLGTAFSKIISGLMWILLIGSLCAVTALAAWAFLRLRKYRDKVIIFKRTDPSDPSSPLVRASDRGGIFKDYQTKQKVYKLLFSRKTLSLDNYNFILNEKKGRTVFIFQNGEDDYRFVKISFPANQLKTSISSEDKAAAIRDYDKFTRAFSTQSFFEKYAPLLSIVIVGFVLIVLFAIALKHFPEAAKALKEAAQALAQARGAVVT